MDFYIQITCLNLGCRKLLSHAALLIVDAHIYCASLHFGKMNSRVLSKTNNQKKKILNQMLVLFVKTV